MFTTTLSEIQELINEIPKKTICPAIALNIHYNSVHALVCTDDNELKVALRKLIDLTYLHYHKPYVDLQTNSL